MFVCVALPAQLYNNTCGEVVIMLAFHSELEIRGAASGTGSIPVGCNIFFPSLLRRKWGENAPEQNYLKIC